MSESLLIKDFKERDVNRLRNLLTLKYGDKTSSQVGYTKKNSDHEEGDVWQEDGKSWMIKNGIKQSITKMDTVRKAINAPLLCPCCNNQMKHPYDKKLYDLHKMCFDCVIKMETKLRAEGKYKEYSMNIQLKNAISFIVENKIALDDYTKTTKDIYYSENGEEQIFVGGSQENSVIESMYKELDNIENELKTNLNEVNRDS